MCISIIVAIIELTNISGEVKKYSGATVPNMSTVWQMRRDFPSIQRYMLVALVESDPVTTQEYLSKAEEAQRVNESFEKFKLTSRETEETMNELYSYMQEAAPYRQEITELMQAQKTEEAFAVFAEQYKPTVDKAIAMMEEIGVNIQLRADEQAVDSAKIQSSSYLILIIVAVIAVILTLIVIKLIVSAILPPIKEVESAAAALSKGDLSATITYDGKDELGNLASNMKEMVAALKAIISDEAYLLGEMAQGNFAISSHAREYYTGDFASILESIQNINGKLSQTLRDINEGSDQVNRNALESANASKQAMEVGKHAETSTEQMKQMTEAMAKISETSQQVVAIINTIEAIATQTNLLSLNAAIEAARAGDAGNC